MVRGFTPIIGLAVVMALALAAVFGSMSLASSPAHADEPITGLKVTSVATGVINLEWDHLADHAEADFQARWAESVDPISSGDWTAGGQTGFAVTVSTADPPVATTAIVSGLTDGAEYNVQIRTTKDGAGPVVMTSATPDVQPDTTVSAFAVSVDADMPGKAMLSWQAVDGTNLDLDEVTGWEYQTTEVTIADAADRSQDALTADTASDWMALTTTGDGSADDAFMATVSGLEAKTYFFQIRARNGEAIAVAAATSAAFVVGTGATAPAGVVTATEAPPVILPTEPSFSQSGDDPKENGSYRVEFQLGMLMDDDTRMPYPVNTRNDELVIEFHEDYGIPGSIENTSVTVTAVIDPEGSGMDQEPRNATFVPEDVTVDGEKIILSLGDMDERDDQFAYNFNGNEVINVHFRQSAGITNPTKAGGYFLVGVTFGDTVIEYDEDEEMPSGFETKVDRKISLDEDAGGRGDEITVTGKGFQNGTTLLVFLDRNNDQMFNIADGDHELCASADVIGGDHAGSCSFVVTASRFTKGDNHINARDGRNNYAPKSKAFDLEPSIALNPASGSPGETIQVQMFDFGPGATVNEIQIARRTLWSHASQPDRLSVTGSTKPGAGYTKWVPGGSADNQGEQSFSLVIPNDAPAGKQDFKVSTSGSGGSDNKTLIVSAPQVMVTPSTIVPNQRVSLVGVGFSAGGKLGDCDDCGSSVITISGERIPWSLIDGGDDVEIDNGGNWSAAVDLPLSAATLTEDQKVLIRVIDSEGRSGGKLVDIPERKISVSPETGRVGTIALVEGSGFPGKNEEGESFSITVEYDAGNNKTAVVSVVPDASGDFEVQLRIPTTASIPSTNTITAKLDGNVLESATHDVPEGEISPSVTSGGPGTTVTIDGEGFRAFAPVEFVTIGSIDITPAPRPHTDGNGMLSFEVLIPGLDEGIQTLAVKIGQTTASKGFTVTESGIHPGDIKPVVEATEPLGDNLVVVFHFNNDTKTWTFYSTNPDAADANTLTHMITGETYLLQVKTTQEAILNRDTRNLTCVGGNCWNQVVW